MTDVLLVAFDWAPADCGFPGSSCNEMTLSLAVRLTYVFFSGVQIDPPGSKSPPLGILGPRSLCLRGRVDFHSGLLLPGSA